MGIPIIKPKAPPMPGYDPGPTGKRPGPIKRSPPKMISGPAAPRKMSRATLSGKC